MRLPGLMEMGEREGVPVITIEQLIAHLDERRPRPAARPGARRRVSLRAEATVPSTARSASSRTRTASPAPTTSRSSRATSPRGPARARALRVPHR
jgi:hypothetical protein